MVGLLSDGLFGITFREYESFHFGVHFRATLADGSEIKVQPNAIPGDDGQDDLLEEAHSDLPLLVYLDACTDHTLLHELSTIGGLNHLRSEHF